MSLAPSSLKHRLGQTVTFDFAGETWSGTVNAIVVDVVNGRVMPVYHVDIHMGANDQRGTARLVYIGSDNEPPAISDFFLETIR